MAERHGHPRQHRSPPALRRPRVPAGERLVRQQGWLTTDHPEARWYRVVSHSADWSVVRVQLAAQPDLEPIELEITVRPDGYVIPRRTGAQLGAEAIRIIATAIRAAQRRSGA